MTAVNTSAFRNILKYSHSGLLASAAVLLGLQALLVSKYYSDMFPAAVWNDSWRTALAFVSSAGLKMLAFFLLFMTVRDFSEGRAAVGKWGLSVTVILNIYFLYESHSMAALWSGDTATYWHLLPFLSVITIMVLFIEWRLAISVNTATREENAIEVITEKMLDMERQLIIATGKVGLYEAEIKREADRKTAAAEQQRQQEIEEAERRKAEEVETLKRQLAAATRALSAAEKNDTGRIKISTGKVEAAVRDFIRKNPRLKPSREQIAAATGYTARGIQNHYQNGSLDAVIEEIFQKINDPQPETVSN